MDSDGSVRPIMKFAWHLATLLTGVAATAGEMTVTFDGEASLPAGWQTGITGKGEAKWEVVSHDSAPSPPRVLRQSGEATFAWAVKTDALIRDGFVEVKFMAVGGKEDQAGGLVFRFRDRNNYYVVRANALENNVVLYKTVDGKRSALQVKGRATGYGVKAAVEKGAWHLLRVEFEGHGFAVLLNGKRLFEAEDDTITDAGAVGVWTKADSVTLFDDFRFGTK